eukprot:6327095-Prorocentrum_lima.AAC.1
MNGVYVEICKGGKDDGSFMICPLRATSSSGSIPKESWKGSVESYQEGSLAHVIGILRAQLTVPQLDVPGLQVGEPSRVMARNLRGICGSRSIHPIN